ncbi:MAG: DNA-processing protein DprA, partial [Acidimicrobiales bacterium]
MNGLPEQAFVVALADLPGIGPATLIRLLAGRTPEEAWRRVRSGEAGLAVVAAAVGRAVPRAQEWANWTRSHPPGPRWESCAAAGISVTWPGQPDFPPALEDDPAPPGALFWQGDLGVLRLPRVAVIGTRRATPAGREVARRLGEDLALGGICVVSGLAQGIDGAAHLGALAACSAGPAGVAASGVDVPFPRQNADLWRQVASRGTIISETPPGRPAQTWRFPTRNRIIAGLVQMVVVVESHDAGGSLITVEAALARGVEVRAVPGPVGSPASAGTNQLLFDGA